MYSSERSGSTLLRMILDSHSQILAPHETHFWAVHVKLDNWYGQTAMKKFGLDAVALEDVLWDRLYHLLLTRAGKSVIVDKTPSNTLRWKRIAMSWPEARYIFLRRHPLRMAESLAASKPDVDWAEHYQKINRLVVAWGEARAAVPGLLVSYEDLTHEPERVTRQICDFLAVPWEPSMLSYADTEHTGDFTRGLGDWSPKIKSGIIHAAPPSPQPDEVPDELREACKILGYL
jgi:hypothetical protein